MHPVLFYLAGFAVEAQGTLYLLAAIIAAVYAVRLCKRRGWDPDAVVPGMLITVLAAFAGARLLHAGGGLSFFGGLATGSFAILGYVRWQRIPVGAAADELAPLGPALYALFRLGCFLNGDDYGLPTRLPWGVRFPHAAPPTLERVHPTQLYEMLAMAPVFLWLNARRKAGLKPGALAFELCALMGAERFLVELWRIEPRGIGGLTTAQWLALALAVIGIVGRTHLGTSLPIQRRPFMRKAFRNRILAAVGILGFVATIVVFDLGCPGGTDNGNSPSSISLAPNPGSVRIGGTIRLDATVLDRHGDAIGGKQLGWSSSNPAVATVSGTTYGLVTGVSAGNVTITATAASEGVSGTAQVSVTNAEVATVTVSGPASVLQDHDVQLTATLKDDGGHVLVGREITWSSSNPGVASVGATGSVIGVTVGTATITATSEGKSGTAPITVTSNPVATVEVHGDALVDVGHTLQLFATLRDASGQTLSLTGRTVTWSSNPQSVATVGATTGLVTGVSAGTASITATSEGKSGSMSVTVFGQPAFLTGRVIDYTTGNGIGGATVRFLDNGGSQWGSVTSAGDGSFTSPGTTTGISNGAFVEGIATGYVTGRIFVASVPLGATTFTEPVPLVPTSGQSGGISGTVRNALNASGISGATVQLFNNQVINPIATQTSDGSGNFSFGSLAAGTYRLAASATGFSNAQRTGVAVGNGSLTAGQDLVLSPTGSTAINIVLTWGNTPSDLDSHLTGPNSDGSTRFHVYYASRGSTTAQPFAGLDVDNTSGRGPETITITQMNSGTYRYSVHDFSDRSSTTSSALGSSGAKVQVYTASAPVQTFFVPSQAGTLWTVFEMTGPLSNPVITPKNLMSFISDPATVTAPPMDWIAIGNDGLLIGWSVKQHPKPQLR